MDERGSWETEVYRGFESHPKQFFVLDFLVCTYFAFIMLSWHKMV